MNLKETIISNNCKAPQIGTILIAVMLNLVKVNKVTFNIFLINLSFYLILHPFKLFYFVTTNLI